MTRFIEWLKNRLRKDEPDRPAPLWQTGVHTIPKPSRTQSKAPPTVATEFSSDVGGRIADGGPGKNVLIRNKYVREDTGTHETLKILDESLLESDEEFGADPYNTGRFDRSKYWDTSRNRK